MINEHKIELFIKPGIRHWDLPEDQKMLTSSVFVGHLHDMEAIYELRRCVMKLRAHRIIDNELKLFLLKEIDNSHTYSGISGAYSNDFFTEERGKQIALEAMVRLIAKDSLLNPIPESDKSPFTN